MSAELLKIETYFPETSVGGNEQRALFGGGQLQNIPFGSSSASGTSFMVDTQFLGNIAVLVSHAQRGFEQVFQPSSFDALVYMRALQSSFDSFAEAWEKETALDSSIEKIVTNRNYQRIIGMGSRVLPLIFKRMRTKPDHWFWALNAITGADPILAEHRGKIEAMTTDWLSWAERNDYLR